MSVTQPLLDFASLKVACRDCSLSRLCLPMSLDGREMARLDEVLRRPRPLRRGEHLFRNGDRFHAIYAIRAGSAKTYAACDDGSEQVVGFHLPGELVGLDALEGERHVCCARALETTSVCELPYERLQDLAQQLPSLQRHFFKLLSQELARDEAMLLLLGKATAEERLATFLLSLSARFKARGFSEVEFNLSMSRHDIGNYLGLAVETVSRMFSRLHEESILSVQRKRICIHDLARLRAMAHGAAHAHQGRCT
jgi:CRP/FNR family transcriptional regulator